MVYQGEQALSWLGERNKFLKFKQIVLVLEEKKQRLWLYIMRSKWFTNARGGEVFAELFNNQIIRTKKL